MLVAHLRTYEIAKSICAQDIIKKHTCIALRRNSFNIKELVLSRHS